MKVEQQGEARGAASDTEESSGEEVLQQPRRARSAEEAPDDDALLRQWKESALLPRAQRVVATWGWQFREQVKGNQ